MEDVSQVNSTASYRDEAVPRTYLALPGCALPTDPFSSEQDRGPNVAVAQS